MTTESSRNRPEKTPAEVNAQVGRIADKLVKRAVKFNIHTGWPKGSETEIDVRPPWAPPAHILDIQKNIDGIRINNRWSRNNPFYSAPAENGAETNTVIHSKEEENRRREIAVSFSDEDSHGVYIDVTYGYGERQAYDLPAQNHTSYAANILMKLRGDIAAQEIAANTTQVKAEQLLK